MGLGENISSVINLGVSIKISIYEFLLVFYYFYSNFNWMLDQEY